MHHIDNMNNFKFKFNDFNGFAIGMPPVALQLVVIVIYWPRVEIFKQMSSESDYITRENPLGFLVVWGKGKFQRERLFFNVHVNFYLATTQIMNLNGTAQP